MPEHEMYRTEIFRLQDEGELFIGSVACGPVILRSSLRLHCTPEVFFPAGSLVSVNNLQYVITLATHVPCTDHLVCL